ncbi:GNAT family N-acetyltransferase [Halalkalibacterium halodurans]|uniref:GNAT family N-acetyltransferase n=1 Tax=Halalkalibacterium halodurans TaxID=86665 RepID=UPI002E1D645F|nr:GNAT family N-acetyltransferase [Halalkalibacterium halodurans]
MLFQKEGLQVRRLEEKDEELLVKWLSSPIVLEFYEGRDKSFNLNKVRDVFYDSADETVKCLVEYEGNPIGYIQYYQLDEKTKRDFGYTNELIFGMDQFIGEAGYWNKGIGSLLVSSMVHYLLKEKPAGRVIMDPQIRNKRALRCYEKCGFNKVRILPKHELHEGKYQDCWLLEYKDGK